MLSQHPPLPPASPCHLPQKKPGFLSQPGFACSTEKTNSSQPAHKCIKFMIYKELRSFPSVFDM